MHTHSLVAGPDTPTLYPLAPPEGALAPRGPSLSYRLHVLGLLASLLLFVGLYLALLGASALGIYLAASRALSVEHPTLWFWAAFGALGVVSLGVFLALFKGLFHRGRVDREAMVAVSAVEQPELFGFLGRLCEETGAPMPDRVYLCADPNAGVFYDFSLLSLLWPVERNLIVGLGLVNALNLSEFKAVLAHEFGHFAQGTMRLTSYVFMVQKVLHEVVYGRDRFDGLLERARQSPRRLTSLGATLLWATLEAVRRTLAVGLRLIDRMDAALSRQMEFEADQMAVRVSGSDAIVHALLRIAHAERCYVQTLYDLRQAAREGLYTRDLFFHHRHAMDKLGTQELAPLRASGTAARGDGSVTWLFDPGIEGPGTTWDSHPGNAERERRAKSPYVPCPMDERSAWELLACAGGIREQITRLTLVQWAGPEAAAHNGGPQNLTTPEAVQAHIDRDHAEILWSPRYQGIYDQRFLEPGELEALCQQPPPPLARAPELLDEARELWGACLEDFVRSFQQRLEELRLMEAYLAQPAPRTCGLRLGEQLLAESAVSEQFAAHAARLSQDRQWLGRLDQRALAVHLDIARLLGPQPSRELLARYTSQIDLQDIIRHLRGVRSALQKTLARLQEAPEASLQEEEPEVCEILGAVLRGVAQVVEAAREVPLPLAHTESDPWPPLWQHLPPACRARCQDDPEWRDQASDGPQVLAMAMHEEVEELLDTLGHLRRKALGRLLAYQESLVETLEQRTSPGTVI